MSLCSSSQVTFSDKTTSKVDMPSLCVPTPEPYLGQTVVVQWPNDRFVEQTPIRATFVGKRAFDQSSVQHLNPLTKTIGTMRSHIKTQLRIQAQKSRPYDIPIGIRVTLRNPNTNRRKQRLTGITKFFMDTLTGSLVKDDRFVSQAVIEFINEIDRENPIMLQWWGADPQYNFSKKILDHFGTTTLMKFVLRGRPDPVQAEKSANGGRPSLEGASSEHLKQCIQKMNASHNREAIDKLKTLAIHRVPHIFHIHAVIVFANGPTADLCCSTQNLDGDNVVRGVELALDDLVKRITPANPAELIEFNPMNVHGISWEKLQVKKPTKTDKPVYNADNPEETTSTCTIVYLHARPI